MKRDKIYNDFDRSYDIAEAVQEIIETGGTDEEKFAEMLAENSHVGELIDKISSDSEFESQCARLEKARMENGTEFFVKKLKQMEAAQRFKRRLLIASSAAASIIAISLFLFMGSNDKSVKPNLVVKTVKIPTIIFEDSSRLEINGESKYVAEKNIALTQVQTRAKECRLLVPAGYTFTIELNDGTEVTLNAGSELIYPETFGGNSRNVRLKGEGYFKVTKSDKPFIVNVEQSYIKVYGTEFNIDAMNTHVIRTVLVEGSVGVGFDGVKGEVMLKPNEMAITNMDGKNSVVKSVDVEKSLAWMSGYFMYAEDSLEDMLSELAAWYDVKFVFGDESLKHISMVGSFKRSNTLMELLTMIEETTNVKFIKEGGDLFWIVKDEK